MDVQFTPSRCSAFGTQESVRKRKKERENKGEKLQRRSDSVFFFPSWGLKVRHWDLCNNTSPYVEQTKRIVIRVSRIETENPCSGEGGQ